MGMICGWLTGRPVPVGFTETRRPSDTNRDRRSKFEFCARHRLTKADNRVLRSVRENDGHLDLATRAQDFQRYVIAVAAHPEIDVRWTQL